jgi:hypothetical protein
VYNADIAQQQEVIIWKEVESVKEDSVGSIGIPKCQRKN